MGYQIQFTGRAEKNFRKERLFYIPPDPKAFELHLEVGGKRTPFYLGYTNNLLEEVRELFEPRRNDQVFEELRKELENEEAKCHLCFYFFTAPSDYQKPIEMATAKWLKWRRDSTQFKHSIDEDYLEVLGADRPFDIEFSGQTADDLL